MPSEPSTRLHAFVATEARVGVILRRGPTRHVRLIRWDLSNDTFEPGQWLLGRIYEDRCGLSPDGRLFVYFAGKHGTKLGTFTALCRPPFFTALALWPDGSTWGGGGFFETRRSVVLRYGALPHELNGGVGIPADFEVTNAQEFRARRGAGDLRETHLWSQESAGGKGRFLPHGEVGAGEMRLRFEPPWVDRRACPHDAGLALRRRTIGMFEVNGPSSVREWELVRDRPGGEKVEPLGRLDWTDWDTDGSLLFAQDGVLFRRRDETTRELADFRADRFSRIPPTAEAKRWP
ncbi:MAG: hypothetical protein R3B99_25200 [Polyangiales bacterium]|nr:hypothetical protein [Myxococcales bacterium]